MLTDKIKGHKWVFDRIGGFDQVSVSTDEDWRALASLDTKLWAVLSCPVDQLHLPKKMSSYLDTDHDGRVKVQEVLSLVRWLSDVLVKPSILSERKESLSLDNLRSDTDAGRDLIAGVQTLLLDNTDSVTLSIIEDALAAFTNQPFNGDGVITLLSTNDSEIQDAITWVMTRIGKAEDVSGDLGIDANLVDAFDAAVNDRLAWLGDTEKQGCWILAADTIQAVDLIDRLEPKINDYFARCALSAFDEQAKSALNPSQSVYEAMYPSSLGADSVEIIQLPIAKIDSDALLPLNKGINPAWSADMFAFRQLVVIPLLGDRLTLTQDEWQTILMKMLPARTMLDNQQGVLVASLSDEQLMMWKDKQLAVSLNALILQDLSVASELTHYENLLKLLYSLKYMDRVIHNFVSLRDLYDPMQRAQFEAGTLYLDSRSMRLCLKVIDVNQHATMAHRAGTFLLYCDCSNKLGEKQSIVAAVTAGDGDQLMVGRHGVFYDREGVEWDAVIVRMIENPISVAEAFWSPYKRVGRLIATQLEKFASARDKAVESKSVEAIDKTGTQIKALDKSSDKPVTVPFDIAKFAGIFAAIGLAVGALGTAVATIISGFMTLSWWQMPLTIAGILLFISGPSMLLAWLKLRKRHLGPILDANGWAINTHAGISIPFGSTLTQLASLPQGAERHLRDPFSSKSRWKGWMVVGVIGCALIVFVWYSQHNLTTIVSDQQTSEQTSVDSKSSTK